MPGKMTTNADGVTVLVTSCEVCGSAAHWGFGGKWACWDHRQQIEAEWIAEAMAQTVSER